MAMADESYSWSGIDEGALGGIGEGVSAATAAGSTRALKRSGDSSDIAALLASALHATHSSGRGSGSGWEGDGAGQKGFGVESSGSGIRSVGAGFKSRRDIEEYLAELSLGEVVESINKGGNSETGTDKKSTSNSKKGSNKNNAGNVPNKSALSSKSTRSSSNHNVVPLSSGETARLRANEFVKSRRFRLRQVREQEKMNAIARRQIYEDTLNRKQNDKLEKKRVAWEAEKATKMAALEASYRSSLAAVGAAHRDALGATHERARVNAQAHARATAEQADAEARHRAALEVRRQEVATLPLEVARQQGEARYDAHMQEAGRDRRRVAKRAAKAAKQAALARAKEEKATAVRAHEWVLRGKPKDIDASTTVPQMGPSLADFSNTRFHATITRMSPAASAIGGSGDGTAAADAFDAADEMLRSTAQSEKQTEAAEAERREAALARGRKALRKEFMIRERKAMESELSRLDIAERASNKSLLNAKLRRVRNAWKTRDELDKRKKVLQREFEKKFIPGSATVEQAAAAGTNNRGLKAIPEEGPVLAVPCEQKVTEDQGKLKLNTETKKVLEEARAVLAADHEKVMAESRVARAAAEGRVKDIVSLGKSSLLGENSSDETGPTETAAGASDASDVSSTDLSLRAQAAAAASAAARAATAAAEEEVEKQSTFPSREQLEKSITAYLNEDNEEEEENERVNSGAVAAVAATAAKAAAAVVSDSDDADVDSSFMDFVDANRGGSAGSELSWEPRRTVDEKTASMTEFAMSVLLDLENEADSRSGFSTSDASSLRQYPLSPQSESQVSTSASASVNETYNRNDEPLVQYDDAWKQDVEFTSWLKVVEEGFLTEDKQDSNDKKQQTTPKSPPLQQAQEQAGDVELFAKDDEGWKEDEGLAHLASATPLIQKASASPIRSPTSVLSAGTYQSDEDIQRLRKVDKRLDSVSKMLAQGNNLDDLDSTMNTTLKSLDSLEEVQQALREARDELRRAEAYRVNISGIHTSDGDEDRESDEMTIATAATGTSAFFAEFPKEEEELQRKTAPTQADVAQAQADEVQTQADEVQAQADEAQTQAERAQERARQMVFDVVVSDVSPESERSRRFAERSAARADMAKHKAAQAEQARIKRKKTAELEAAALCESGGSRSRPSKYEASFSRLLTGERAAVSPRHAKKRTNRNYKNLPEVVQQSEERKQRAVAEERRKKVAQMEKERVRALLNMGKR